MRSTTVARWATCALALGIFVSSATASNRSIAACTTFAQVDKDDDSVEFTVKNSCSIPVDCSLSWEVVCAPKSKTRRVVHADSAKLSLAADRGVQSKAISAAVCGDDSWMISGVAWSCAANND
jgi:hypothetical protein